MPEPSGKPAAMARSVKRLAATQASSGSMPLASPAHTAADITQPLPWMCTAERRWPRYKVDVPVQLATQGLTNGIIVQGRGSELNCGGMAVSGRIELSIGEQVALEFTPPYSGQP